MVKKILKDLINPIFFGILSGFALAFFMVIGVIYFNQAEYKANLKTEFINNTEGIQYVYFYQDNCEWCKKATPVIEQAATETSTAITRLEITKEDNQDIWDKYDIEGTPTIIKFEDGKEINRLVGYEEVDSLNYYKNFLEGEN